MPLDTQPLSRTRQTIMVAVLLALFAASMALAHYLVVRKGPSPELSVDLSAIGFQIRHGESLPDEIEALTGAVAGHPRRVDLFSWAIEGQADGEDVTSGLSDILRNLLGNSEQGEPAGAFLGDIPAVQQSAIASDGKFAIARGAGMDDRIVVICYSGPVPYTDADKATFERMCVTGLKIHEVRPR